MFSNNRTAQDFGKAAKTYDDNARLQQRVLNALLQKANPLLAEIACHSREDVGLSHDSRLRGNNNISEANILDAGAGTGALAKLLPHASFTQLDIAYPMCTLAAKNGSPTLNADAAALPFADASFDAAFSSLVFQWLPDWHKAFDEMQRVVKPGGLIAISTLGEHSLYELRMSFAATDNYPHVSPFLKADDFWQKETITEHFPDFHSILKNLKAIGAGNKLQSRRKGMMTKSQLQKVEAYYCKHFTSPSGLCVTWEVLYYVRKQGAS